MSGSRTDAVNANHAEDAAPVESALASSVSAPVWRFDWLTPGRCRILLGLLLAFGLFGHIYYLKHDCPVDLSGDEAQYWDWSRQLDLSYYSKGPLVAYIIRLSCTLLGQDTMFAVRLPAVVLATCTTLLVYLTTRRLFGSDKLALGTVLLYHAIPMFVAGSLLMTIDPPYFFCWALATYLLIIAVFEERSWPWLLIGVIVGVGFLAKYAMLLWFLPMVIVLATDARSRRLLKSPWPWLALLVALTFLTPVIVWNARNHWVSFRHVSTQTGTSHGSFSLANVGDFLGGQFAVIGPAFAFIIAGCGVAIRGQRTRTASESGQMNEAVVPEASPLPIRQLRLLAWFGGLFFAFCFFTSFRTKVQLNWPAPAYFTLTILAGWFIAQRLGSKRLWKGWRIWFYATVAVGLLTMPIAHYSELLFPVVRWVNASAPQWRAKKSGPLAWVGKKVPKSGLDGRTIDFTAKLKGLEELGQAVSKELETLGPDAFVLAEDYQQSAQLAFYVRGQPKTYYAGSYYHEDPKRHTQYDIWPDRSLTPTDAAGKPNPLLGKNAVFLGHTDRPFGDLTDVFDRVEGVTVTVMRTVDGQRVERKETRSIDLNIARQGVTVRTFRYFRCYGFKGMTRPMGDGTY